MCVQKSYTRCTNIKIWTHVDDAISLWGWMAMFETCCTRCAVSQHQKLKVSARSESKMNNGRVHKCSEQLCQVQKHQHMNPNGWHNQTVRLNVHTWQAPCPLPCLAVSTIDNFSPQRGKNDHMEVCVNSEKLHQVHKHQHTDPCRWHNQTVRLNG